MATQAEIEAQLTSVRRQMLAYKSTQFADRSASAREMDELIRLESMLSNQLAEITKTRRPKQSLGVASKGF